MSEFRDNRFIYRCGTCGGRFAAGPVRCLVAHAPGDCCHYGDEPVSAETDR